MRTVTELLTVVETIGATELEAWIEADLVRPERGQDELRFTDADIARVRLIQELRADLGIDDETLPLVLSLLDQLYATRRRLRTLAEAVSQEPAAVSRPIMDRYRQAMKEPG